MANPFKKEVLSYKGEVAETPYQRAYQEWDDRIGSARVQAENWRIIAAFSLVAILCLLLILFLVLAMRTEKLFIAEVTTEGKVVNVAPLRIAYNPTIAQKEYFVGHFIELIRSVPLDPVVAKKNWLSAYDFLNQRAITQLNEYLQQHNPLTLLGKKTVVVKINEVNPLSDNSFTVSWMETTANADGQNETYIYYSGIFTLIIKAPATQQDILRNPLGIYIVSFNITTKNW